MITVNEVREKAREKGLPESTIERDYVQNWFLRGLYSKDRGMVFKGGTAIKKAYINDYRFSDDLDFTMLKKADDDYFKEVIEDAINTARDESGVNFEDRFGIEQNLNGWEGRVYFRFVRQIGSPIKIKLDISKIGSETMVQPPEERPMFHNYSDECTVNVQVYSLQETMAEKVRSLFQRSRGRDLYDVSNLWGVVKKEGLRELFEKKCKVKGVTPEVKAFKDRKEVFHGGWQRTLGHQIKVLPDFERTFEGALAVFEELNVK